MSGKTTWIGILKVTMGSLGVLLAGSGVDLKSGRMTIEPGTAPLVLGLIMAYFALSGVQAYLTQDRIRLTSRRTKRRSKRRRIAS